MEERAVQAQAGAAGRPECACHLAEAGRGCRPPCACSGARGRALEAEWAAASARRASSWTRGRAGRASGSRPRSSSSGRRSCPRRASCGSRPATTRMRAVQRQRQRHSTPLRGGTTTAPAPRHHPATTAPPPRHHHRSTTAPPPHHHHPTTTACWPRSLRSRSPPPLRAERRAGELQPAATSCGELWSWAGLGWAGLGWAGRTLTSLHLSRPAFLQSALPRSTWYWLRVTPITLEPVNLPMFRLRRKVRAGGWARRQRREARDSNGLWRTAGRRCRSRSRARGPTPAGEEWSDVERAHAA